MVTFTALAKIIQYFCNTKVVGLGEIFVQRKTSAIWLILLTGIFDVRSSGSLNHWVVYYIFNIQGLTVTKILL